MNTQANTAIPGTLDFSIVLPAYNEAEKIEQDVLSAATFLNEYQLRGEVIVIDDGSDDDTSAFARRTPLPPDVELKVVTLERNFGKGYAVRQGILQSQGTLVMFADCGVCIPFDQALEGIRRIKEGEVHIAIASRRSPGSRILTDQSLYRRLCSWAFRWCVRLLLPELRNLHDTQCGFKVYQGGTARKLFAQTHTDGFLFDVEILVMAHEQGLGICQFPVVWTCDRDSRLSPSRHSHGILRDLWAVRRRHR